jgi:hypothetical protein
LWSSTSITRSRSDVSVWVGPAASVAIVRIVRAIARPV